MGIVAFSRHASWRPGYSKRKRSMQDVQRLALPILVAFPTPVLAI